MAIASVDEVMLREPRLLVPGNAPTGNVKIDKGHPLGKNLLACTTYAPFVDLVSGKSLTAYSQYSNYDAFKYNFGGIKGKCLRVYKNDVGDCKGAYLAAGITHPAGGAGVTDTIYYQQISAQNRVYCGWIPSYGAGNGIGWKCYLPAGNIEIYGNSYATISDPGILAADTSKPHIITLAADNNSFDMWFDGVLIGSVTTLTVPAASARNWYFPVRDGNTALSDEQGRLEADYYLHVAHGRKLSVGEIRSLHADPYQFLTPA
jgi:hypothetical protein